MLSLEKHIENQYLHGIFHVQKNAARRSDIECSLNQASKWSFPKSDLQTGLERGSKPRQQ